MAKILPSSRFNFGSSQIFSFDFVLKKILVLVETGLLSKIRTGFSTLSGGEAQRLKLASELTKGKTKEIKLQTIKQPVFMFWRSQPLVSIKKTVWLLQLLRRLVKEGNTVVVVEHDVT